MLELALLRDLEHKIRTGDKAAVDGLYRYLNAELTASSARLQSRIGVKKITSIEATTGKVTAYAIVGTFILQQVASSAEKGKPGR